MQMAAPLGQVSLRPVNVADHEFLVALYISTRLHEFALTGWSRAEIDRFLRSQFDAQDRAYRASFPGASFRIIQLDGADIGRLYADRQNDCLRVIDLSLGPEWRGRGIGKGILRALMQEAAGGKVPVRMSTHKDNPALALYQRLGFAVSGDLSSYWALEWQPPKGPHEV